MPKTGQLTTPLLTAARTPPRLALFATAFAALLALVPSLFFFDFAIDDAWIPVRYARHLARHLGYRFNESGPVTDGVTPLPYPFLLAPFARGDASSTLLSAKLLNLIAWVVAAGLVGASFARETKDARRTFVPTAALAVCFPTAIHATTGLETGIATLLVTLAVLAYSRASTAAFLFGLATTFRPELVPSAVAFGVLAGRGKPAPLALSAMPFVACTAARWLAFGHVAPLSVAAKPSDLSHGLAYSGAAVLLSAVSFLALPNRTVVAHAPRARAIILVFAIHAAVVSMVGGDWMPYARLFAPLLPALVVAFFDAWPYLSRRGIALRGGLALLSAAWMFRAALEGRHIGADRSRLISESRPIFRDKKIAALDIGWPSAATEKDLVDLAGLTDEAFAYLPGGHTSKRIDGRLLLERDFDVLVLLATSPPSDPLLWWNTAFYRGVEARLSRDAAIREAFVLRATFPISKWTYLALERTNRR